MIDSLINKILNIIKAKEQIGIGFRFGGFMWDVPQLTGNFWSAKQGAGGSQITLEHWTGKDCATNILM